MATQDKNAERSQQLFDQAGDAVQQQLAGLGARFNQLRDAAAQRLPFLARKPEDPAKQKFLCSGVRTCSS